MKGYTNQTIVRDFAGDASIVVSNSIIEQAEQLIDNYTGRSFIADSVDATRYYDGDNSQSLMVDDCVSITSVSEENSDGTWTLLTATTYALYPLNATLKKIPYDMIFREANYWTKGSGNYKVIGKFGYSVAVPYDIVTACNMLIMFLLNYKNAQSEIESEKIGDYSVAYKENKELNDKAFSILKNYKKMIV